MSGMDLQPDFALVADGLEAATLQRRDGIAATALRYALRRTMTVREAEQSNGRYTTADLNWHLDASELTEPPRLGDRLLDAASEVWTVLEACLTTGGSRWLCVCRNLRSSAGWIPISRFAANGSQKAPAERSSERGTIVIPGSGPASNSKTPSGGSSMAASRAWCGQRFTWRNRFSWITDFKLSLPTARCSK